MPTDRKLNSDEMARRNSYDHSAPKDSNFNPGYEKLKGEMKRNYVSPGLQGASHMDHLEAYGVDQAVPRRKD